MHVPPKWKYLDNFPNRTQKHWYNQGGNGDVLWSTRFDLLCFEIYNSNKVIIRVCEEFTKYDWKHTSREPWTPIYNKEGFTELNLHTLTVRYRHNYLISKYLSRVTRWYHLWTRHFWLISTRDSHFTTLAIGTYFTLMRRSHCSGHIPPRVAPS